MENKPIKLIYRGKQKTVPHLPALRLWDVKCEGHAFNDSTRTLVGLVELKIVPKNKVITMSEYLEWL